MAGPMAPPIMQDGLEMDVVDALEEEEEEEEEEEVEDVPLDVLPSGVAYLVPAQ